MTIIDEKGRLFGKLNIIDAAVVVLLGVFLIAAALFLVDTTVTTTVHAQVEASDVPAAIAASLSQGTELDGGRATVTDVRTVPVNQDVHRVFAKVTLNVEEEDGRFLVGQDQVSPGASIPLNVQGRTIAWQVAFLDDSEELVPLQRPAETFMVSRGASLPLPSIPEPGEVVLAGTEHLLEIEGSIVAPVSRSTADVFLWGTSVRYVGAQDQSEALTPGAEVSVSSPTVTLPSVVLGNPENLDPPVRLETIQASAIVRTDGGFDPLPSVGSQESVAGQPLARVTDRVWLGGSTVQVGSNLIPAASLGSEGGESFRFSLNLTAVSTPAGLEYKGDPVVAGREISFEAASGSFDGTLTTAGDSSEEFTGRVTVTVPNVPGWAAGRIAIGSQEFTDAGQTLVTVTNKTSTPATVVLSTDDGRVVLRDHPTLTDLTLRVELDLDQPGWFKGQRLSPGATLSIAPDGFPLEGTVMEIRR